MVDNLDGVMEEFDVTRVTFPICRGPDDDSEEGTIICLREKMEGDNLIQDASLCDYRNGVDCYLDRQVRECKYPCAINFADD